MDEPKPRPFCGQPPESSGGNSTYGRFWWVVWCNSCQVEMRPLSIDEFWAQSVLMGDGKSLFAPSLRKVLLRHGYCDFSDEIDDGRRAIYQKSGYLVTRANAKEAWEWLASMGIKP